jgi:predicted dehydrogenase
MAHPTRHSILVIGAGSIGERHLRCFLKTDRAKVSFVETNSTLRETISNRYPAVKMIAELKDVVNAGISAAVIATPAPSHVPLALEMVNRGIHVLIEKPLAISFDGIDALRAAVREQKTLAAVAYVYRAHPALAEMRQAIVSGRFGRPLEIVAVAGQHFATYRPAYAQTYYASHASGGGAVQDALTHILNAGQWLVGPIDRIVADAAHQSLPDVDVEDTVHVMARHGNVLGSYSLNQHQAANEVAITVICESGVARFEYHACHWRSMQSPDEPWNDHSFGPLDRDELFIRQANSFLDAIEGGSPPLCTLDEAVMTLRSNITILESIRQGRWLEVAVPQR